MSGDQSGGGVWKRGAGGSACGQQPSHRARKHTNQEERSQQCQRYRAGERRTRVLNGSSYAGQGKHEPASCCNLPLAIRE